MATLSITHEDLLPFAPDLEAAKATEMISDVLARAKRIAPCLDGEVSDDVAAAAKGILRDVLIRWHEAGSGAVTQRTKQTGPYQETESYDSQRPKPRFWPSEIKELQDLCREVTPQSGAFSVTQAISYGGIGNYYPVTLPDGTVVNLYTRPDLWVEYGPPPGAVW